MGVQPCSRAGAHVLGPVQAHVEGRDVPIQGWRMGGVLARLALDAPAPVPLDHLVHTLWGEDPPASAVNAVQVQISHLRRAVGPWFVERSRGGYRLSPEVWVDAREFETAVRRGLAALDDGAIGTARNTLEAALQLWRGDALQDVPVTGLEADARRLSRLRIDALRARAAADLLLGRHASALADLRDLVAAHPYDEQLRGHLMTALYRCGRQEDALATYAECVRLLRTDLGVDPTPELAALHRRLLQHQDPGATGGVTLQATAHVATADPVGSAPIGREDVLNVLVDIAERTAGGVGHVVLLGGEAGLGKTTVVDAFARHTRATVLTGQCLDLGPARLPYGPVLQALRPVLREPADWGLRLRPSARATLGRLVPELDDGSGDDEVTVAPELRLTQLYEHLLHVIQRAAAAVDSLVMVLEDIHWCDPATSSFLAFLLGNLADVGVLVLMTARTDDIDRHHPASALVGALNRSPHGVRLELPPLPAAALDAILDPLVADRGTRTAMVDLADGNPLYAVELATGEGGLTTSLSDLLLERLQQCGPLTQRVLVSLAAAGRTVTHDTLTAVTGLPEHDVTGALREALSANLLVAAEDGSYRFRHDLIAEAVVRTLLPHERQAVHAAWADVLLQPGPPEGRGAASLVRHLRGSGRLAEELVWALEAGRWAQGAFAHHQAQAMFERVAELWTCVADPAGRTGIDLAEAYEAAARCALADLRLADTAALAGQALAALDVRAEPTRAAQMHVLRGRGLETSWAQAEDAYRTALAVLPPGDTPARAGVEAAFATALMFEGRFAEAERLAADAAAVAARTGQAAHEAEALTTWAVIEGQRGRVAAAEALFIRARAAAEASGSVLHQIRCARSRSGILANDGRFDEAIAECWRGIGIAGAHSLDRTHGMHLHGNLLGPLTDAGRLDEAITLGLEAMRTAPEGRPLAAVLVHTGTAAVRRGDLELARRLRDEASATMGSSRQASFVAFWGQLAAEVAMAEGDHQAAFERAWDAFAATTRPDGPTIWTGEVGALVGEAVRAGGLDHDLSAVVATVRSAGRAGETRIQAAERLRLEALAEAQAARPRFRIIEAWERASAAYAVLPMPQRHARCQLALTRLHLAAGDRDRALAAWSTASRIAREIGAAPLAAQAAELGRIVSPT